MDTLELTLFDVESKSFPDMVKVAQKRESSQIQIEDVRCVTVQAKSVEIHVNVHLTEGVCL